MRNMKREALDALARRYPEDFAKIYASIKDGHPIDEVTVAEWADQWMSIRVHQVRPGTYSADSTAVYKYIVPTIGDKPLAGLQRQDLRDLMQAAHDKGLSNTTVQRIHSIAVKMLHDAIDEGHDIPERALRVKTPPTGAVNRAAIELEDARRILDVVLERPDSSRWVAALTQGLRPAEARGLRWQCIDLDHNMMHIDWQLKPMPYRVSREPKSGFRLPDGFEAIHLVDAYHLVRPKTASGIRAVPIVPWLRAELATWRALAPDNPWDLVWTNKGRPIEACWERREWLAICEKADVTVTLPDGTKRRPLLYECRHTAATLMYAAGVDETTLTGIVGHSKIASTKAYLHTNNERKLQALQNIYDQLGVTNNGG